MEPTQQAFDVNSRKQKRAALIELYSGAVAARLAASNKGWFGLTPIFLTRAWGESAAGFIACSESILADASKGLAVVFALGTVLVIIGAYLESAPHVIVGLFLWLPGLITLLYLVAGLAFMQTVWDEPLSGDELVALEALNLTAVRPSELLQKLEAVDAGDLWMALQASDEVRPVTDDEAAALEQANAMRRALRKSIGGTG